MRRRPVLLLTAVAVATAALPLSTASAVVDPVAPQAGPAAVRMRFDAGPEPVAKGATITLAGRVWRAARGNKARVDFYFRAGGTPAGAFTYQGFAMTSDAGNFSRSYPALTTGTWKAVFAGSAGRRNAARLDAVQVFQRRSREIAGWAAQSNSWRSPTIRIPTKDYKALVSWTCAGTGSPFIRLTWTGEGGGAEYVHGAKPAGTLTLNGHAGARKGFFKVSSAADCAWKVRVFAGITAFQV
ncbi:hypothetical protein [Actinoplanes sp. NPDC049599]|uniref:hypothetical protein n=1 Tax=Actinoplanes sp. NPDC049599 TaxID=3363903 RepID=UPI0037A1D503